MRRDRPVPGAVRSPADLGSSLVGVVLVLVMSVTLASLALPATSAALDEGKIRQAATFVATRLRDAKQQALGRTASTGLVFDLIGARWTFRVCVDGNGNGIRRSELKSGKDVCVEGPLDLAVLFPGVTVSIDSTIRGPDDDPPASDPVKFGSSDIASFSPFGSCTAGSLYLRSARGMQYAVRVAGGTGRTRILRYDAFSRTWRTV